MSLTPDQKQDMADLYRERNWLYNLGLLAAKILKTKTSGSEAKPLTSRGQWVFNAFSHVASFTKRLGKDKRQATGNLPPRKEQVLDPVDPAPILSCRPSTTKMRTHIAQLTHS